jgi:hypothetical protein
VTEDDILDEVDYAIAIGNVDLADDLLRSLEDAPSANE